jgi:predicted dehydrogenase
MKNKRARIGFIGAGGIARSHAFSLKSLRYYYDDVPDLEPAAVCSATPEKRDLFADRYGFRKSCDINEFISDETIDTVFILGPNNVHYEHLKAASGMKALKRIYLEKPVCSDQDEAYAMKELAESNKNINIQVGFQFLFTSAIRQALAFWKTGKLGKPVHFELKYYHGDYLKKDYRVKRASRLTPAPDGGAMADLGSHALSLLIAFMGKKLHITGALQAGHFEDVPRGSDLFSQISLYEETTGAVGTVSASRISSGTGDSLSLHLYAEKGSLRYSSESPDIFEFYTEESGLWSKNITGSNFRPASGFPSVHVPSGWLRSMIHAQYVFLTGGKDEAFIPDLNHGLAVQRLIIETAEHLERFRNTCI